MQTQPINIRADQPTEKWHESIVTLPLYRFIDVLVDGNYWALVISGRPTMDSLLDAWKGIENEYTDAIGEMESTLYLSLLKETAILQINYDMACHLVEILEQVHYAPLCEKLNALLRTTYAFNPENIDQYRKELKSCMNRAKSFKIELHLKEAHLKAIRVKNETDGQPYTREYFQSVLITISDYAKYPISQNVTVYEFCERIRRFNEYYKNSSKK